MENLLKTIREVQIEYPDSHVGGGVGLFLRGIELPRKWAASDLDIITPSNFSESQLIDIPLAGGNQS